MKLIWRQLFRIVFISAVTVSFAAAQSPNSAPTRFAVGGNFIVSQPKEEFRRNVDDGVGGGANIQYNLLRSGWLGLRFDVSGVEYGREKKRVPLSSTVGARILVDVTTTNSIADLSWGPEFAVPRGRVRPYVNMGYSHLFFRTTSSVRGKDSSDEEIASTTNHKDGTGAWVWGGGLRIPLGGEQSRVSFDAGVRYHRGGEASYLREGSIVDNPDGSITITPLSSRTPFMTYTFGIQFRIPYNTSHACSRFVC